MLILAGPLQAQPILSFFNEMKSPELVRMFSDSAVTRDLQALNAEIRMGLLDLTPERASVIRRLNKAGIPVTAWLLLPEEKGYWFHPGNGHEAKARYLEVREWARQNRLSFKHIGLDMELDMNDVRLLRSDPWTLLAQLPGRLYDKSRIERAGSTYDSLLDIIRADGYTTESYYASFVKDEVKLGNTALQQLTGFMDIRTEREIPMLYGSFLGNPDGLLSVYGKDAGVTTVAIGSTGGGFDTSLPILTYDQLVHDLRLASSFATEVHIFSLEGCVSRGFLSRLVNEDRSPLEYFDPQQTEAVRDMQTLFQWSSSMLNYPTALLTVLIASTILIPGLVIWLLLRLFRTLRRRSDIPADR